MGQEYHFIRNALKLAGITLVVYVFMEHILPIVLPFFVAAYLATLIYPLTKKMKKKRAQKQEFQKKKIWNFLVFVVVSILMVAGIFLLLRYFGRQLLALWNDREKLFFWEDFPNDGILGQIKAVLQEEMRSDHMIDGMVKSAISGLTQVGDTLADL